MPASAKTFSLHVDHEAAFIRVSFCKVDLIPLAGFAEVDNVSQILFCRWRDIAVWRSQRVKLEIPIVLHLVSPPSNTVRTVLSQHHHRSGAGTDRTG